MIISNKLYELARILYEQKYNLYIVGGYVRDSLLHRAVYDIDICSSATPMQMLEFLQDSNFIVKRINKKFGTMTIISEGFEAEYTTFRKDSYFNNGEHKPTNVVLVEDITVDSYRRDLRINAIYYDIIGEQIVDITRGLADIENRQLNTTAPPQEVLEVDALRILRILRFAVELDFSIPQEVEIAIKNNIGKLEQIQLSRIGREFKLILVDNSSVLAISKLVRSYNLYANLCEVITSDRTIIQSSLDRLIQSDINLAYYTAVAMGSDKAIDSILRLVKHNSLYLAKFDINKYVNIIEAINNVQDTDMFLIDNYTMFNMLEIVIVVLNDNNMIDKALVSLFNRVVCRYNKYKDLGLPLCVKELGIRGSDIEKIVIARRRGEVLREILLAVITGEIHNEKNCILEYVEEVYSE